MIDKIKDMQEIIISRINNAIVGGFLISFTVVNSRGILTFIYSDRLKKLQILNDWKLDYYSDVFIPMVITFAYMTILPLCSSYFQKKVTNKIYEKEQEADREKKLIGYRGMESVAISAVKSTHEYADKFVSNELQSWINERESTLTELNKIKTEFEKVKNSNDILTKKESSLKLSQTYYAALYERCINSMNSLSNAVQNITNTNDSVISSVYQHNKNSIEHKNAIIKELVIKIKEMIEVNNSRPTASTDDWVPPLNDKFLDELLIQQQSVTKSNSTTSRTISIGEALGLKGNDGK
ncbi:hypothetical protein ACET8Y_11220 [Aeromonas veronii]